MTPRPRFEKLEEEKKETILRAAGEEFGTRGFVGASLNKIIEKAGISKGATYYYFDDKADLYATVVDHVVDEMMALVDDIVFEDVAAEEFWPWVESQSLKSLQKLHGHMWMARVLRSALNFAETHPDSKVVQKTLSAGREWTRRFLKRGQELGQVRDDVPLEFLVDVTQNAGLAMDRWLFDHMEDWSKDEEKEWVAVATDMMRRLLEPREER